MKVKVRELGGKNSVLLQAQQKTICDKQGAAVSKEHRQGLR